MFLSSWWNQSTSLRYQICENTKESSQIHQWYQVRVIFSISNSKSLKGPNTHISRYAFVEFGNSDECKAARGKLATTQFKGKELIVDFVGEVKIIFFLELLGPFPTTHHPGEQEQVTEGQIWGQGTQQIKPDQVDFFPIHRLAHFPDHLEGTTYIQVVHMWLGAWREQNQFERDVSKGRNYFSIFHIEP